MGSVNKHWLLLVLILTFFAGCGGMMNDLNPSSSNKSQMGQIAPDFTLSDTLGNSVTLSSALTATGVKGVVLYFTMWCPTCDVHMSSIRSSQIPIFPNVRFYAVDYYDVTVADARNSELSNGYDGSGFIVLADTANTVLNLYHGTMGITVVIDKDGIIRMNEVYDDNRLTSALTNLP
jgi:peroxiredoxin